MAVERFVVGVGQNALAGGEFLLMAARPVLEPRTRICGLPRVLMDIAVAGVGVSVTVQDGIVVQPGCYWRSSDNSVV